MKTFTKLITAVALTAFAGIASAVPLSGSIAFGTAPGANWTPVAADLTTVTSTSTAVGVKFNAATIGFYSGYDGLVSSATGDYSSTVGVGVDFNSFVFNPLTSGTQLWSFTSGLDTYSFAMDAATIISQTANSIDLQGGGFASATNFDTTFGEWSLTLNNNGGAFSFSSSAAPEPAIALLLATGLIGFGFAHKARKA